VKSIVLVTVFLCACGQQDYSYITPQGVEVYDDYCTVCPAREIVEATVEYYAMRAPDLFNWAGVRRELDHVRVWWFDEPLPCIQSPKGCALLSRDALGFNISSEYPQEGITYSGLFHELTKIPFVLQGKPIDYQSQVWGNVSVFNQELRAFGF